MSVRKRGATYEDIRSLPEHLTGELIDGDLYVIPRPRIAHAEAAGILFGDLLGPFHRGRGGPGGWWILIEPEVHLGGDVLVPDLAGWRRERLPRLPDEAWIEQAPDWICEVLSPSTKAIDRVRKLPRYAKAGVQHAWLVDPEERSLEVLRRHEAGWLLVAGFTGDERVRAEPFEAVELELGGLWLERAEGR